MTRTPAPPPSRSFRALLRSDTGSGLTDLLVAMLLLGVLVGLGAAGMKIINGHGKEVLDRTKVWGQFQEASGILNRDITDATTIRVADANTMTLAVVRNGACNVRTYEVTPEKQLDVSTTFYEGESCSGASETNSKTLIELVTGAVAFHYYNPSDREITAPVQALRNIKRVGWTLEADHEAWDENITLPSAAAYNGRSEASGTGTEVLRGGPPSLSLDFAVHLQGVDRPALKWTDPSSTITQSWAVFRSRAVEGQPSGGWVQVGWIGNPLTTTWVDPDLGNGETAIYAVHAVLNDGTVGPTSNAVVSGRRPSPAPAVTVTGAATSILVTWPAVTGTTAYDIYRDGILLANLGNVLSFTDATSYGHAHDYRLVPSNRWEARWTTGSETLRLAVGALDSTLYAGKPRVLSATNVGANTAPSAVGSFTSAQRAGVGVRTNDLAWTAPTWIGARAATTTSYRVEHRTSAAGSWATAATVTAPTVAYAHTGRPAGLWGEYRIVPINAIGDGAIAAQQRVWQRPATPTCTTSGATTRSMVVNGSLAATADESYAASDLNVRDGGGAWVAVGSAIDPLPHSTLRTFGVRANGFGGWSDEGTCTGTTLVLAAAVPTWTATTRSITAGFVATNGSVRSLTLGSSEKAGTSAGWDPLTHDSGWPLFATNTDGYNTVNSTTITASTDELTVAIPAAPGCSVSSTSSDAPATMTVTGGYQVRMIGDPWYASGETYYRTVAQTYTYEARARNTNSDGYQSVTAYSGAGTDCSYTLDTPPPPPPPAGYSTTFPASCDGTTPGAISSAWFANYSGDYWPPSPFNMGYKLINGGAAVSWAIDAEHRTNLGQWDTTGGTQSCTTGAPIGV